MIFSKASGLEENPDKSSTYFGGICEDTKRLLSEQLGVPIRDLPFRYLGIPLVAKKLSLSQCRCYWTTSPKGCNCGLLNYCRMEVDCNFSRH